MNHNNAIESQAAERYMLGELSNAERDAYEEHMFNCAACAEEVKYLSEFGEGARMAFQEGAIYRDERPGFWAQLWQPVPRYACMCALLALGFGTYLRGSRPDAGPVVTAHKERFELRESRAEIKHLIVREGRPFSIQVDIPDGKHDSYKAVVSDATNVKKFSLDLPDADDGSPEIVIPGGVLQPGRYSISLQAIDGGSNKGEVAQFAFVLELRH